MQAMPWIITFGPLSEGESWEPVVCGPYERAHALSLAETVIADDEELMAVVEPVLPHASVDEIRSAISESMAAAAEAADLAEEDDLDEESDEDESDVDISLEGDEEDLPEVEPTPPPPPAEIRAGFARIANRLAAAS